MGTSCFCDSLSVSNIVSERILPSHPSNIRLITTSTNPQLSVMVARLHIDLMKFCDSQ